MTTNQTSTLLQWVPLVTLVATGVVLILTGEKISGLVLILAAAGCETKAYAVQHANTNPGSQTATPTTASTAESRTVTSLLFPKSQWKLVCQQNFCSHASVFCWEPIRLGGSQPTTDEPVT